jgi:hypothetical protein
MPWLFVPLRSCRALAAYRDLGLGRCRDLQEVGARQGDESSDLSKIRWIWNSCSVFGALLAGITIATKAISKCDSALPVC